MMFSRENRTMWDDTKLGFIFGFFGGYCNAVAVSILLYEVAPMSANWGGLAKEIGALHISSIISFIGIIFCFIIGAFTGAKWIKTRGPLPLIFFESILLLSVALIAKNNILLALALSSMAMGIQNGMTTQVSHHKVRTTHLTSTVTDIGISLARGNYKDVLVKGSKTLIYMWGAFLGVIKTGLMGQNAFAMGGFYLLIVTLLIQIFVPRSEACARRDLIMEEWFTGKNSISPQEI